jgi:hypothetical protein
MWRLRRIVRRTKNVLRWLPVIWKDEQWDYYFIFEVLKHKLIIMSDHIGRAGNHTMAEYDASRMRLAVKLIEKVQNEDYLIETINEDNLTREMMITAERKHFKAKRILFKLLDQYIERWWD